MHTSSSSDAKNRRQSNSKKRGAWVRAALYLVILLLVLATVAYSMGFALQMRIAIPVINGDKDVMAQERADGIALEFGTLPSSWAATIKQQMNSFWQSAGVEGVNYYTFAGPHTLFSRFSDRSDPGSPYYQAWFGAYVLKPKNGAAVTDLAALGAQLAALDQQSWLDAMGDPRPLATSDAATQVGTILIDGHTLPLWHSSMHSHSDLSASVKGLAGFVGMPTESNWQADLDPFHDVSLDGYSAGWVDSARNVAVFVYASTAAYDTRSHVHHDNAAALKAELLTMMRSVRAVPVIKG